MYHIQRAVDNWTRNLHLIPAGTPFKAFQEQLLLEAKLSNPGLITIKRHWYDPGQVFNGGDYRDQARRFLDSFINQTFLDHAHAVDYIEGFNEYHANGQPEHEVVERNKWAEAFLGVWNSEYRTQPELSHIRPIIANTAVGNDIPVEFARLAQTHDAVLGYHPYMPMRNGKPYTYRTSNVASGIESASPTQKFKMAGDPDYPVLIPQSRIESASSMDDGRRYFWLRWQHMDALYQQHGYRVEWMFTEFGPLDYTEYSWGLGLNGGGGWRHPNVCNGNIEQYIEAIQLFWTEVDAWNKQNGNRAYRPVLFTTNGNATPVWRSFETAQPEMDAINHAMVNFIPAPPPVVGPPPSEPGSIGEELHNFALPFVEANNDSALQKAIWADGWDIGGPEKWTTGSDGKIYATRTAVSRVDRTKIRTYYAEAPKWDRVLWWGPEKK